MHPRNIYKSEPDFIELAKKFESFNKFVNVTNEGRAYINFKDPKAVKELCVCLLKKDFDLNVDFPLDKLCPAIPNRLNYILWMQDLLSDTDTSKEIKGIDIGVGASCIYPLLGCKVDPKWSFLGTEIDSTSYDYAKKNVQSNQLEDRIQLVLNPDPKKIFILNSEDSYSFCLCNPPFYSSQEEIEEGLANKEFEPSAVCTGKLHEMITEGGEIGFIQRMIQESLEYRTRIGWYSSLIGLKRSIRPLIRALEEAGIQNYLVTRFSQGKTTRWAIAWSFRTARPSLAFVSYRPQYQVTLDQAPEAVLASLVRILEDLEMVRQGEFWVAKKNSWSRGARRLKARKMPIPALEEPFVIKVEVVRDPDTMALMEWIEGGNKVQCEGFWSHLKKRLEEACGIHRGSSFSQIKS